MPGGRPGPLIQFLRRVAAPPTGGEQSDGLLLERFARERDPAAFAALVRRHGAMVLSVCKGVLHDSEDAEDAFQATFLVLVSKAGSVAKPESVASWLHGVASRLAMRAKADRARRGRHERRNPRPAAAGPEDDPVWRDLRPVLHEEIERLPVRYRTPFVLCYLEGLSNEEAARHLRCPKGTVQSNLSRARERLRARLTRRGVTLVGGLAALALAPDAAATVPAELAAAVSRSAASLALGQAVTAGALPAGVAALVKGASGAVLPLGRGLAAAVLLAVSLAGTGMGIALARTVAHQPAGRVTVPAPPAAPAAPRRERVGTDRATSPGTGADRRAEKSAGLRGEWVCTYASRNDEPLDAERARRLRLTISPDRYRGHTADGPIAGAVAEAVLIEGPYRVDTTATPGTIDVTLDRGPAAGTTARGIYRLEGDTLTLCYALGGSRPAEFRSPRGARIVLTVWKREKR
jgi:RNA polymerase sigma factor (sigma-70 family)